MVEKNNVVTDFSYGTDGNLVNFCYKVSFHCASPASNKTTSISNVMINNLSLSVKYLYLHLIQCFAKAIYKCLCQVSCLNYFIRKPTWGENTCVIPR